MHTEEQKKYFWRQHRKILFYRTLYGLLGLIFYPFILRSKTREKVYNGTATNWTLFLWNMLNDDEIEKHGVDYDVDKVKEDKPHYNLDTKWGRFKASYWFNAIRNHGYNYLLSNPPYEQVTSYDNKEYPIDNIREGVISIDPIVRAEWVKTNGEIDLGKSKIGEGEVWYNPNGDTSVSLCRYSRAWIKTFWKWNFYITYQKGEFQGGGKYDSKIKIHTEKS